MRDRWVFADVAPSCTLGDRAPHSHSPVLWTSHVISATSPALTSSFSLLGVPDPAPALPQTCPTQTHQTMTKTPPSSSLTPTYGLAANLIHSEFKTFLKLAMPLPSGDHPDQTPSCPGSRPQRPPWLCWSLSRPAHGPPINVSTACQPSSPPGRAGELLTAADPQEHVLPTLAFAFPICHLWWGHSHPFRKFLTFPSSQTPHLPLLFPLVFSAAVNRFCISLSL